MSGLTAWIMSITGVVCLGALADVLMAEGSTKKYVKGIVALIVFAAILAPIPAILKGNFDFGFGVTNEVADDAFVTEVAETRYRNAEAALETALAARGYEGSVVRVYLNYGSDMPEVSAVVVDVTLCVINQDKENINIREDIAEYVAGALGVEPALVTVLS